MTRIPAPPTESVRARAASTPMTCLLDGREHEVADGDLAAGCPAGAYRTLCDVVVWPVPLTVPAGRPCRICALEAAPGPEIRWERDPHRARRMAAAWLRGVRGRTTRSDPAGPSFAPSSTGASDVAA